MTPREAAIKRITDAGGRWPPSTKHVPPWRGTGRFTRPLCAECGYESRPMSTSCELCGEALP